MKWFGIVSGVLLVAAGALYALLFTSPGNALLAPVIEKKIVSALGAPATLSRFVLRSDHFEFLLQLTPENRVEAAGNFGLLSQSLNARYKVALNNLHALAPVAGRPLQGSFGTDGTVTGHFSAMTVEGSSGVAGSDTAYTVQIDGFSPSSFKASVKKADIAALLAMTVQPPFANGTIALDADIAPLNPEKSEGTVVLNVTEGRFDSGVMRREFNVTLPATSFSLGAEAKLHPGKNTYSVDLNSNLATVHSEGVVTPQPFAADLTYRVDISELAMLKPLTNAALRGPFATRGSVKGDAKALVIDGTSDVAESETAYKALLKAFAPATVTASVKHARLDRLLYLAGQDAVASGNLEVDIDLKNLDPAALKGNVDASITHGTLNKTLIEKKFGLKLVQTELASTLHAALAGDTVTYSLGVDSSVGTIASEGSLVPKDLGMRLRYDVDIRELGVFESLTKQPLRGPLKLQGTLKGDRKRLEAAGTTDLARSDTAFSAVLENLAPRSAEIEVKHLKLDRLFRTLDKPAYATADVNVHAKLPDLREGKLDGTAILDVTWGKADRRIVAKAFEWPDFTGADFTLHAESTLKGNEIATETALDSNLLTYRTKRALFDLKALKLTSDFSATVPDLKRIVFLVKRPMQGKVSVTGDLSYDRKLLLHANSNIFGGAVKATLKDQDLHADLTKLRTVQALHMLTYPEVFDGALNGTVDYNLGSKKGLLDATLSDGHFTRNTLFDLLRQYTKNDMYREEFKGVMQSRINDMKIDTDMDLRSDASSISTKHALVDSQHKQIDAKVNVTINRNPIDVLIKGNLDKPNIQIDAKKLIEREAGKQINKLIDTFLK